VLVESSDLLFAVDSIPAVFAVTRDPFIAFTSNVFAILGLRSLYFALAAVLRRFRYLEISLAVVLAFVGVKMLLSHHYPIPSGVSLAVIGGALLLGVLASLGFADRRSGARAAHAQAGSEALVDQVGDGRGDVDRRVGAEQEADEQREGDVAQHRRPEHEETRHRK
jgi:tellurite resistance protein TerC